MATKRVTAVGWYPYDIAFLNHLSYWAIVQPGMSGGTGLHPFEGLIAFWDEFGVHAERGWTVSVVSPPAVTGNTASFDGTLVYEHAAVFDVTYPDWYTPNRGSILSIPNMPGSLFDLKVEFNSFIFYYARISKYPTAYAGYNPDAVPYLEPTQSVEFTQEDETLTMTVTGNSQYAGGTIIFAAVWAEYAYGNDFISYPANAQGYAFLDYPATADYSAGVPLELGLLSSDTHQNIHIALIDSYGYIGRVDYDFLPEEAAVMSSLVDAAGHTFIARNGGHAVTIEYFTAGILSRTTRATIANSKNPSIWKDKSNNLYLLRTDRATGAAIKTKSRDNGRTWA